MKHLRRKKNRSLVTSRIVYTDRRFPEMRPETLVADLHQGEVIDDGYAAAVVAVRTGIPFNQVRIVAVEDLIPARPEPG